MIVGLFWGAFFALIYVLSNRIEAWRARRRNGPFPPLADPLHLPAVAPDDDAGPSGERGPRDSTLVLLSILMALVAFIFLIAY